MLTSTLLLVLMPLLLVIVVIGSVLIVALYQAKPEDVPAVVREAVLLLGRLVTRLPHRPGKPPTSKGDEAQDEEEDKDDDEEEVAP